MHRRIFLSSLLAASATLALAACAPEPARSVVATFPATPAPSASAGATPPTSVPSPTATPTPTPTPTPTYVAPALVKVAIPGGVLTALPGAGSLLAWTVDDGMDAEVIRRYIEFAAATGTRLTFFLNGSYPGWTEHADLLLPLVQSGQIQLANHTWSHINMLKASDGEVVAELQRNHDFILSTFGVDARPYYRPPYGYRNARTDHLAASIGYTTPVLWYGSLSDSGLITDAQVVDFATQWFLPQHIVIGHLNFVPVTEVFPQLHQLVVDRGLTTVTLNDVFLR